MNKRGGVFDVIVWIILAFVVVMILAAMTFAVQLINTEISDIGVVGSSNFTEYAELTVGKVEAASSIYLEILAFIIVFGMIVSIFISNYMIKANPVFYAVHVLITVIGVIVSIPISNEYEKLLSHNLLGNTLMGFEATTHILLNLPTYAAIVGIVGALFLYMNIQRDRGMEGDII